MNVQHEDQITKSLGWKNGWRAVECAAVVFVSMFADSPPIISAGLRVPPPYLLTLAASSVGL